MSYDKGSAHRMLGPIAQLKVLREIQSTNNPIYTEIDTFILRDLAFTHGGRGMPYVKMIEHLILALTPLAVAERLKQ